jgi:hypothetical protein
MRTCQDSTIHEQKEMLINIHELQPSPARFKAQFGKTPEEVRKSESIEGLRLVDGIRHLESRAMTLKEPCIRKERELLFVEHVPYRNMQNIAGQWERFMSGPYGEIDHKIAELPVGITPA